MRSCALLVVAHTPLGDALLQVAAHILGASPDFVKVLDVSPTADRGMVVDEGLLLLNQLDRRAGAVILCDCKGSTPGNIAEQLHSIHFNNSLVFGLNLPMLLRAINYCGESHHAVAAAAVAGAKKSILESEIRHD